jgi:hypothetical protein
MTLLEKLYKIGEDALTAAKLPFHVMWANRALDDVVQEYKRKKEDHEVALLELREQFAKAPKDDKPGILRKIIDAKAELDIAKENADSAEEERKAMNAEAKD